MVFGKTVEVKSVTKDRYGRTIAWVYVSGTSLNEELLRVGLAWHYKKYSKESHLAELEEEARVARAGLWSDPHAVPPWDFRRGKRSVSSATSQLFTGERKPLRLDTPLVGYVNRRQFSRGSHGTKA
jgi:endonuclease YncB( thermonuclease family)